MSAVVTNLVLAGLSAVLVMGTGEWTEDAEDLVSRVEVDAVLGRTTSLPCDVTPDSNEDRVYMVLWFRKSGGKPIYSFDVRGRSFNKALQWSDPGAFGPRAYFATVTRPPALTLSSVQLDDEGTYRCRVDFKNSPTRNFQIKLSVIVPPHQMMVYDKSGADVSGVVGPLEEGSALVLVCEVRGGRPQPTVSWLVDDEPAPQYLGEKTDSHVVLNRLELPRVTRTDLNKTFRCRASNTALVPPQEKVVRLEMHLPPLSVSLRERPQQLVAGAAATLRCVSSGSRPPAQLAWYKENRSFDKNLISEYQNETFSISSLILNPKPADHGATVKCIATNPALPAKALEDQIRLNVVYSPLVSLKLGSTLNPHDIKEGDDVYFECIVRANPREHRIAWFHNDKPVTQNMSSGVILSTRSLVLQRVTRRDAGGYSCKAANTRGESASETVRLRVQYAPVCAESTTQVVGAALDEVLKVRCTVNADPTDVTFVWQFNNSGESIDVSSARYDTMNGSVSELRYAPASERDYGALSCRGTNSVGRQLHACVFQIVPAARPSPPRNCSMSSANESNSIEETVKDELDFILVRCVAGYDGGLPQLVVLEALDSISGRVKFNVTANETDGVAIFLVPLSALWSKGEAFKLTVHSRNDKGASERVTLHALPYQDPEPRTDGSSRSMSKLIFWMVLLASVACVFAGTTTLVLKRRRSRPPVKMQPSELQINAGDGQYVVAYTLKPNRHVQPDILNPPLDGDPQNPSSTDQPRNGTVSVSDWDTIENASKRPTTPKFKPPGELQTLLSPAQAQMQSSSSTSTLSRRCHLKTEDLPGPESCV